MKIYKIKSVRKRRIRWHSPSFILRVCIAACCLLFIGSFYFNNIVCLELADSVRPPPPSHVAKSDMFRSLFHLRGQRDRGSRMSVWPLQTIRTMAPCRSECFPLSIFVRRFCYFVAASQTVSVCVCERFHFILIYFS